MRVNDARGYTVAECINSEIASELVRRWNSYEELVSALKDMLSLVDDLGIVSSSTRDKAKAAITAATSTSR